VRIINDRSPGVEGREVEHLARGTGSPQQVVVEGVERLQFRVVHDDEDAADIQATDLDPGSGSGSNGTAARPWRGRSGYFHPPRAHTETWCAASKRLPASGRKARGQP
jgi:hypothetical protein